jgi:hypothetical protein
MTQKQRLIFPCGSTVEAPLPAGNYFVDPVNGDDGGYGLVDSPWKSWSRGATPNLRQMLLGRIDIQLVGDLPADDPFIRV